MGFTTSYANTILTNLFSGAKLGLSTTTPNADGTNISEPSASAGYERTNANDSAFTIVAGKRTIKNAKYVYYPEATASWGTITHLCVYDSSGGLRYFGALNSPVAVPADTVPLFKPNAIQISLDAD